MTLENRLGHEVYRPIGLEWYSSGYWNVYDHPATAQQYLTLAQGYQPKDGSQPLNNIDKVIDDVYYCQDIDSGYYNKAITLDYFKNHKFDIIIASLPQHLQPFQKLIYNYQPEAKLIFQIGNNWLPELMPELAMNVLASAKIQRRDFPDHILTYHQEFDLSLFNPDNKTPEPKTVTSLLNVPEHFVDYNLCLALEQDMQDDGWKFYIHGGQGRDGPLHGTKAVADKIKDSRFIWQVKAGGDGYGHILYNSGACGVPMIVKKSYYAGKLGEELLIDGETCVDLDGLTIPDMVDKIKYYNGEERYQTMCANLYSKFVERVDFDREAKEIGKFLEWLI